MMRLGTDLGLSPWSLMTSGSFCSLISGECSYLEGWGMVRLASRISMDKKISIQCWYCLKVVVTSSIKV